MVFDTDFNGIMNDCVCVAWHDDEHKITEMHVLFVYNTYFRSMIPFFYGSQTQQENFFQFKDNQYEKKR